MFDFLDPEHLLTNTRSKVCSTGMPKSGISKEAWLNTAWKSKENGSGLSLALVENVLDKHNVGYALKTFGEEVETAMRLSGYSKEAEFCRLVRNWYRAQDEGGISSSERHRYEQDFRRWLLKDVKFDIFPPPGKHVKDIPIILYEGLLVHIDRRSQLYVLTDGLYNSRSIGTLDNENLFGTFLDWDAKGTGVLRAEEVPHALFTASDLYQTRINKNRGFHMHTSSARVYPMPPSILQDTKTTKLTNMRIMPDELRKLKKIKMRDHAFDMPERRKRNPKRKRGTISDIHEPSRGTLGVRAERYTVNESKILPHVRAGIELPNQLN